jgi:GDP-L-fucose synthase
MIDLKTKRITVTGGRSFLGTHLVKKMKEDHGCENVFIADLPEYDIRLL